MRATAAAIVAALAFVSNAGAVVCNRPTGHDFYRLHREYPRFDRALHRDFGSRWWQAAIVSFGEGSWHAGASNGCYHGTFQMGCRERQLYGDSRTLEGQAAAAARYSDHGRDWSHWDCRP